MLAIIITTIIVIHHLHCHHSAHHIPVCSKIWFFFFKSSKAKFISYCSKGVHTLDRVLVASSRLFSTGDISGFLLKKKDSILSHFQIMQQDGFILRKVSNGICSVWLKANLWSQNLVHLFMVLKAGLHLTLGAKSSLSTDNTNIPTCLNLSP